MGAYIYYFPSFVDNKKDMGGTGVPPSLRSGEHKIPRDPCPEDTESPFTFFIRCLLLGPEWQKIWKELRGCSAAIDFFQRLC
jgi:hypothetical protein